MISGGISQILALWLSVAVMVKVSETPTSEVFNPLRYPNYSDGIKGEICCCMYEINNNSKH